jgi:hypothetical protein
MVLHREQFADGLQFLPMRLARPGIAHFEALQRIDDNLRNDEPGVIFVIGRHDIPGRGARAGCAQARLVGLHVMIPQLPLFDISKVLSETVPACI